MVLIIVAGAAAASLATDGLPANPPRAVSVADRTQCEPVQPTQLDGSPIPGGSLTLYTNGAIRMRACGPSTLRFLAQGTKALGVYARLVVSQNGTQLVDVQVEGKRHVSLDIPTAGWVMLAFVNDLYTPPADRNLRLEGITFRPNR